MSESHFTLSLI